MIENIFLYIAVAIAGLIFQSILPAYIRMILIYPLAFVLGLTTIIFSNYFLLAFGIGMTSRAAIGGYWFCVALEGILLISGIFVGYTI